MRSALENVSIDLLINNAGILRNEVLGDIDPDQIRQQFETNALAPLLVTEALMGCLVANAKVALITSRMGSVTDNTSGGRYGYRMSKSALNIAGMSLAHDLKPRGVSVAILHPGLVGTEMIGGHGDITPDQAAERLSQRIDGLTLKNSGTFWHSNGDVLPW
jgi:NAD(P)-dependent dehydrogenase (short-subunit alcohol dehydrogenase family)